MNRASPATRRRRTRAAVGLAAQSKIAHSASRFTSAAESRQHWKCSLALRLRRSEPVLLGGLGVATREREREREMADCLKDADCEGVLVCYLNVSWGAELGFGDGSFCECDYFYGWQQSADGLCSSLSLQSYTLIVSSSLQIALVLVALAFAARGTARVLFGSGPVEWDASTTTLLFLDGAFFGIFVRRVAGLAITATPERNTRLVASFGIDDIKAHEFLPLERTGLIFTYGFTVLACLNVSWMWLQVAASSRKLSRKANKNISQYIRALLVLEVVWVVVLVVATVLGQIPLAAFLSVPFGIFFVVSFAVGRSRMESLLSDVRDLHDGGGQGTGTGSFTNRSADRTDRTTDRTDHTESASVSASSSPNRNDDDFFDDVIHRIRRTTAWFIAAAVFSAVCATTFAAGSVIVGQREANRLDNKLHYIVMAAELTTLGLAFMMAPLLWYVLTSAPPRNPRTLVPPGGPGPTTTSLDHFPTIATDAAIPATSTKDESRETE